jgi:hypothetical protein
MFIKADFILTFKNYLLAAGTNCWLKFDHTRFLLATFHTESVSLVSAGSTCGGCGPYNETRYNKNI